MTLSLNDAAMPARKSASIKFEEYICISHGIIRDETSHPEYLFDAATGMSLTIAKNIDNNDFSYLSILAIAPKIFAF